MPIKLYNSLSRRKEDFTPLDRQNVRLYVCGPTVYDRAHIGNARPFVIFDLLFRLLRYSYGHKHVTYVRNLTDIDDKINARASQMGISIRELTDVTTAQFHRDIAQLGTLPPTIEPRATEYIPEMIAMISVLVEKQHAYVSAGHVLFSVASMPDYGQLSRRSQEDMLAGARVEIAPYKRNEMDFVLWKPSKTDEPGWKSPWGYGRPGWHIECSAMSAVHLGKEFDIHGGGIDLIFPHHENEIAQSCCRFDTKIMAQIWMHNGFLQVEGQKMSKSLGNFYSIGQLLEEKAFGGRSWPGAVLRLALMKTHYRQPIDFTRHELEASEKTIVNWQKLAQTSGERGISPDMEVPESFIAALSDDLNTPRAWTIVHELAKKAEGGGLDDMRRFISALDFSGFLEILDLTKPSLSLEEINAITALIDARLAARKAGDFVTSDRIRKELTAQGIEIRDEKDGTTHWEKHV